MLEYEAKGQLNGGTVQSGTTTFINNDCFFSLHKLQKILYRYQF